MSQTSTFIFVRTVKFASLKEHLLHTTIYSCFWKNLKVYLFRGTSVPNVYLLLYLREHKRILLKVKLILGALWLVKEIIGQWHWKKFVPASTVIVPIKRTFSVLHVWLCEPAWIGSLVHSMFLTLVEIISTRHSPVNGATVWRVTRHIRPSDSSLLL